MSKSSPPVMDVQTEGKQRQHRRRDARKERRTRGDIVLYEQDGRRGTPGRGETVESKPANAPGARRSLTHPLSKQASRSFRGDPCNPSHSSPRLSAYSPLPVLRLAFSSPCSSSTSSPPSSTRLCCATQLYGQTAGRQIRLHEYSQYLKLGCLRPCTLAFHLDAVTPRRTRQQMDREESAHNDISYSIPTKYLCTMTEPTRHRPRSGDDHVHLLLFIIVMP